MCPMAGRNFFIFTTIFSIKNCSNMTNDQKNHFHINHTREREHRAKPATCLTQQRDSSTLARRERTVRDNRLEISRELMFHFADLADSAQPVEELEVNDFCGTHWATHKKRRARETSDWTKNNRTYNTIWWTISAISTETTIDLAARFFIFSDRGDRITVEMKS